jgi:hypothetical protein
MRLFVIASSVRVSPVLASFPYNIAFNLEQL